MQKHSDLERGTKAHVPARTAVCTRHARRGCPCFCTACTCIPCQGSSISLGGRVVCQSPRGRHGGERRSGLPLCLEERELPALVVRANADLRHPSARNCRGLIVGTNPSVCWFSVRSCRDPVVRTNANPCTPPERSCLALKQNHRHVIVFDGGIYMQHLLTYLGMIFRGNSLHVLHHVQGCDNGRSF